MDKRFPIRNYFYEWENTLCVTWKRRYIWFTTCSSPRSDAWQPGRPDSRGRNFFHSSAQAITVMPSHDEPGSNGIIICYFAIVLLSRVIRANKGHHCTVRHCGRRYKTQLKVTSAFVAKKDGLQLFWAFQVLTTPTETSGSFLKPNYSQHWGGSEQSVVLLPQVPL